MKKFEFRLETLLRVRRANEDRLAQEHRLRRARVARKEADLATIVAERGNSLDELARLSDGELDLGRILALRRHLNQLSRTEGIATQQLQQAGHDAKVSQDRLASAAKEREAVERLRERAHEAYLERVRREEAAEMDEIARNRHLQQTGAAE